MHILFNIDNHNAVQTDNGSAHRIDEHAEKNDTQHIEIAFYSDEPFENEYEV